MKTLESKASSFQQAKDPEDNSSLSESKLIDKIDSYLDHEKAKQSESTA